MEDLVYRNGLTIEGVEEFNALDAEHEREMLAIENERTAIAALAWDQRPFNVTDGNCIVGRAFQFGDFGKRSERKRNLAQVNPYGRRLLISAGDAEANQIVQPAFGDDEERRFQLYLEAEGVRAANLGLPWQAPEWARAEETWLNSWFRGTILPPWALPIQRPAVAAIFIDAPADVNAANNDDIVFYLRDLSSSLVNSRKNATAEPSYKAVPVCCLSSSVSVDVLGLMHERTGHFHKN